MDGGATNTLLAAAVGACLGAACLRASLSSELAALRELANPSDRGCRRIVTANDASGKAVVLTDGAAPCVFEPPMRDGVQVNNCWRVSAHPHVLASGDALASLETCPSGVKVPLAPAADGSTFRVISFSPEG